MLRTSLLVSGLLAGCASSPRDVAPDLLRLPLQHTSAGEVMPILEEVLAPRHLAPTWRGEVDATTNSLFLRGTPEQLREITDLVTWLDVPSLVRVSMPRCATARAGSSS